MIAFAGAIFSTTGDLKWYSRPKFFHGDADVEVPYDKIRFRKIGFYGSDHIAKQLKELNAPYYFHSVEGEGYQIANFPHETKLGGDRHVPEKIGGRQK